MTPRCSSPVGRSFFVFALLSLAPFVPAVADVPAYVQSPDASGARYKSAWYAPDGLDSDEYVWDAFTLSSSTPITQVRWRGAYTNYLSGAGKASVYNFTIAIYASIPGGSQPDVVNGRLVRYYAGNNAGETLVGVVGGAEMYDYQYTLPSAFQAAAGTKYWLQIIAWQGLTPNYYWPPDWSLARGTGGDNSHFRRVGGTGGSYANLTGDCAFTLMTSNGPSSTIGASAAPAGAGSVSGAGTYPNGASATLIASPNTGFGFVNWTENAAQVSTNQTYTFVVSANRTLVANFVSAHSITTNSMPNYGGTTSGGGVFNDGAMVTVQATAAAGFEFASWMEFGSPVSTSPTYSFVPTADTTLTALFVNVPGGATFDFDNAPVHTGLPITLSAGQLSATLAGGYSVQAVGELGIAPAGFSGLCLYPSSVFASDLTVDFSAALTDLSILYSPQELGCDTSATLRVTVFRNGQQVASNTATAPTPGTWPTGTLSISVAAGFDRAVIHYDARPPTCQDWGPIFLADNLTVTMQCLPVSIINEPADMTICPVGGAVFATTAAGTGVAFRWQSNSGANWVDLTDGFVPGIGLVAGAATDILTITEPQTPQIEVRCSLVNPCGSATTRTAVLTVKHPADLNCDGVVNNFDIDPFVLALIDPPAYAIQFPNCTPLNGDVDCSGALNNFDIDPFVQCILSGGCN